MGNHIHLLLRLGEVSISRIMQSLLVSHTRRWSAYVHRTPDDSELAGLRRSSRTGMPFGEASWVDGLGTRLGLDLAIRPRGRPRTTPQREK